MDMFKFQIIIRSVKRTFANAFLGGYVPTYNTATIKHLLEAVYRMYGVDYTEPQFGHNTNVLKQSLVVLLSESGQFETDTELTEALLQAGVAQRGFSRRNVTHLINTMGDTPTDGLFYNMFVQRVQSIL